MTERREIPPTGILQEWVAKLGLRHQGVLLTAVRGCDTAPRFDYSKLLSRAVRGAILNTHCANPEDAKTFIEVPGAEVIMKRLDDFRKDCDHYPHHFVMHLVHAIQVIAYHHPDPDRRSLWLAGYQSLCRGLHVPCETKEEMDARLSADEETFGNSQSA